MKTMGGDKPVVNSYRKLWYQVDWVQHSYSKNADCGKENVIINRDLQWTGVSVELPLQQVTTLTDPR